jgi:hypothetical protein
MIETVFEGNRYSYHKRDGKRGMWFGLSGSGGLFPGANCVAPRITWPELVKSAVASGVSRSEFAAPKLEKKPTKKRSKKISGPSISIFSQ